MPVSATAGVRFLRAISPIIEHHCGILKCPAASERLPVYVTDQDIYRSSYRYCFNSG